jgi:hypothetical protein
MQHKLFNGRVNKRWLMGTHQGSFEADHLQAYLDELPKSLESCCCG